MMDKCCGSIFYIAPEVFLNSYTEKCDVWSIGIITFTCLFGHFPFDDKDLNKIEDKVLWRKLKFSKDEKKSASKKVRKFLKKLLKKNFKTRLNVHKAL